MVSRGHQLIWAWEQQPTLLLTRDLPLILGKVQPLLGALEALLSSSRKQGRSHLAPSCTGGVCSEGRFSIILAACIADVCVFSKLTVVPYLTLSVSK